MIDRKLTAQNVLVATLTLAAAGSAAWLLKNVATHGLKRTVTLIWEGDPLLEIRSQLETINDVKDALSHQNSTLSALEEGLERAKLDSVDSASESSVVRLWQTNSLLADLRTQLAWLSDQLDKLAAKVDDVMIVDVSDPALASMVRDEKKQLSKRIVAMMERVDYLMEYYSSARSEEYTIKGEAI